MYIICVEMHFLISREIRKSLKNGKSTKFVDVFLCIPFCGNK